MLTFDTDLPADSLEFCPQVGFEDIFVCGTYKLVDSDRRSNPKVEGDAVVISESKNTVQGPQTRKGQCLLFRITKNPEDEFRQIQRFNLPAILDMKWGHRSGAVPPILAIADSEGSITVHEWREQSMTQIDSIRCATSDTLVLSIDWSNRRRQDASPGTLIASLSNGSLCILTSTETGSMAITNTWHAHDHEPWVAAWNYWNTNIIYSGKSLLWRGDDLKLKAWDVRQGFESPAFVNKRFDAGVTSIQSHPYIEHLLAVGSYDNTVKLFDTRKLSTVMTEADVGGGAWRIKWCPSFERKSDLLVASMHDGFKVMRFGSNNENSDWSSFSGASEIVNRNDEHESMAYGADWCYGGQLANGKSIVGGCSFYDHKIYIWSA
ncbi:WD40 repeat-like protein [Pholiota conissans]|uniref:WD40 repeat-like protein n=1 Tax=Pholiota conissans TaxID=109636 RepID=A0A9P5Z8M2_9AGAR|nr:WD40 repeat-like protein [Pholiota conissans]